MEHDNKTATETLEEWKVDFKKEMMEHVQQMNDIVHEVEKQKDFLAIFNSEVKAWGGSAHIPMLKKYKGHKVRIIILNEKAEDLEKN